MVVINHVSSRGFLSEKAVRETLRKVGSAKSRPQSLGGFRYLLLNTLLLLFFSSVSLAKENRFYQGKETSKKIWFWEQIFRDFGSDYVLIHDLDHPHLIIDVIHQDASVGQNSESQDEKIKQYLERYRLGINRFKKNKKNAILMGSIEKRLYHTYSQDPKTLNYLLAGKVAIRSQTGLADRFAEAAKTAENYLPYMERIFSAEGLPIELTRIAFVESMFQVNALSKVGAKGIWQLMPATARKFITVNRFIDERSSPFKASIAAAKFLRENHDKLKSWPLTITSYNHGVYGMLRAVKSTGSKNLDVIVDKYKSSSFKFASKNFYAEFIAANNIYSNYFLKRSLKEQDPLEIEKLDLPNKLAISQLIRYTPLTESLIKRLNPCLQPLAFQKKYRTSPLLNNYSIFVPRKIAAQIRSRLKKVKL